MIVNIPISLGELLDNITIFEIKSVFTNNEYISKELYELNQIKSTLTQYTLEDEVKLKEVNLKLWTIEDRLREKEKLQEFDEEFIKLACSVYITNDLRAAIKKKINDETQSTYQEVKLY